MEDVMQTTSYERYAQLLVDMYRFSKGERDVIATILRDEDIVLVERALDSLRDQRDGKRLETIVRHYYGLPFERLTQDKIGAMLPRPITGPRVGELRKKALRLMVRQPTLRPLVLRMVEVGLSTPQTDLTLSFPSPDQERALQAMKEPESERASGFLIDHLPGCTMEAPCPTCQARALLEQAELLTPILRLAEMWRDRSPEGWEDILVEGLQFSILTQNRLREAKITTLGELCQKTEARLLQSLFGRKSVNEVKDFLAQYGKQLRQS